MHVIRVDDVPNDLTESPLLKRGPVTHQRIVTDKMARQLGLTLVHFSPGARNKFHTHTTDEICIVTAGKGILATDEGERVVTLGDIVYLPPGEKHWHGATKDSAFSHMSLTALGSKTTQLED